MSTTPGAATPPPLPPGAGEFLWKTHAYTNEYIRFGDGKAGALIAWSSALIAGLYSAKVHLNFTHPTYPINGVDWGRTALVAASAGAFVLLILSVIAGMLVIWPRLWTGSEDEDRGWLDALKNRFGGLFKR